MANKVKRISINTLEKCVSENINNVTVINWRDVEITVKHRLDFEDMIRFVDKAVKLCFSEDGEYMPEIKDFVIRSNVLELYANFTLPANIEKQYELVYACDAYKDIMGAIDMQQFNVMLEAIDDKIDNIAQANIEAINKQMNELCADFEALQDKLASLFAGVDSDAIKQLVGAMSNGAIDETKLINAYMDAKNIKDTSKSEGE